MPGGNLGILALFLQVQKQLYKLFAIFLFQGGKFLGQQPFQIVAVNGGHLNDSETAGQRLVQLTVPA